MIKVYSGILLAVFFWGSAFVGISLSLPSYSPLAIALGRTLIAAFLAALLYFYKRATIQKLSLSDRIKAALLGMLGMGIYTLSLSIGEKTVPAGVAGFIVGQMPLIASVLAVIFLKEKVKPKLWVGIGISILGLFLITMAGQHSFSYQSGLLWVIISAFCGAAYTCMQKSMVKRVETMPFICHAIWGSTFLLGLIAFVIKEPLTAQFQSATPLATSSIIYLGCFPSLIAYIGWSYAISKVNIAKAGVLLYGMPLVGGVLAWWLLAEKPMPLALVGMGLAFMGCLIGSVKIKTKPKAVRVVSTS